MPLTDVLQNLLAEARKSHPVPATTTLRSGLEIAARMNPPRLILSRTATDEGRNVFTSTDPRSEKEGFTCAVHLGWQPWLTWTTHADRDYLIVCDRLLWYGLRDHAVSKLGGDTEQAIYLQYDINDQNPPPHRMWELCAEERLDNYAHEQLLKIFGLKSDTERHAKKVKK